jgi:hypothetical protein
MAYISQETKKELAPAIKAVAKKYGVKVTIGVNHHSSLVVRIKEGALDFIGAANKHAELENKKLGFDYCGFISDNFDINPYHSANWYKAVGADKEANFIEEMIAAMKGTKWYDNSDAMTDYFDTAYYLDLKVGRWDTPYVYTA